MKKLSIAKQDNSYKKGFTLAEVLITLAVIGVVSAITMPMLIQNVQKHVKAKRIENIQQKLSKATDKMAVQSGLTGYGSTMDFVQELSKHMKLAKICDNDNLSSCWPVEKVVTRKDGTTWNIKDTKTARDLKIYNNTPNNYDNTVGIITADGTPMILSYNKNCEIDVDRDGISSSNSISSTLGCISGVFDWNGGRNPNKLGDDVILLSSAIGLGNSCAIELDGTCYTTPFTPTPITKSECESLKSSLGIQNCYYNGDNWAGAVKECGHVSKLPKQAQLAEMASVLYNTSIGITESKTDITYQSNFPVAQALGLTPSFYLWSGEENDRKYAYGRDFDSSGTGWVDHGTRYGTGYAVCIDM